MAYMCFNNAKMWSFVKEHYIWMIPVLVLLLVVFAIWWYWRQAKIKAETDYILNKNVLSENEKIQSKNYHNEKIYGDFRFFYQTTLVILGAAGFLLFNEHIDSKNITDTEHNQSIALVFLGSLELFAGFTFSMFLISHQAAKIKRWREFPIRILKDFLGWTEAWMLLGMLLIGSVIWVLLNKLA